MSFSNRNNRVPKVLVFSQNRDQAPKTTMANIERGTFHHFLISGQGVYIFTLEKEKENKKETNIQAGKKVKINLLNKEHKDGLILEVGSNFISLTQIKDLKVLKKIETTGIIPNTNAFYWFSLDSHNMIFRYGVGEARLETQTFEYKFDYSKDFVNKGDLKTKNDLRSFLQSISDIKVEAKDVIKPLKVLRDPVVLDVPLCVKDTAELTMTDIAENKYLPSANLSPVAKKLYDNIAGPNFVLNTPDFPEFAEAIEFSINNNNGWCYKKLREKSTEFGPKENLSQTYLRITLGANSGESPGVPYVMEIWPPGHYSPIHNHAGANAIIRVLHGEITVKLFRFLEEYQGYAVKTFSKGDITWISPELNQIHQLKNLDSNSDTCITIQCYMYDIEDETHYNYFDYLNDIDDIEHFDPDSDADFIEFKKIIKKEWESR